MYTVAFFKEKLPNVAWLVEWNPMTIIIEAFRYMTLGENAGHIDSGKMIYVIILSLVTFLIGLAIFNKTEKSFIDTI